MDDFDQLKEAIQYSQKQLEDSRNNRVTAIKQYVGMHYMSKGSDKTVPINFLELATTIYVRLLAPSCPRCMVSTDKFELRAFAANMEMTLNQIPQEIDFERTLKRVVLEAIFGIGVVKIGVAPQGHVIDGVNIPEPFVDLVQLDDYFLDMTAKDVKDIQFEGNTYWMSRADAEAFYHVRFDAADDDRTDGFDGQERADSVGRETNGTPMEERVELADVYVHSTGEMITYRVSTGQLVHRQKWDGPDGGPYLILGFEDVPGNLMPMPPVAIWTDMHVLANLLFRKVSNQADRKKTVAAFQGGNEDEVQAFQMAKDGDAIRYTGVKPESLTSGGIDSPTLAFIIQLRDLFSYFSGNLDSLGGLGPQAETATQDQLISNAANARIKEMSARVSSFCNGVFRHLAWYLWTDPVRKSEFTKGITGFPDVYVRGQWTPETRDGDFLDYNFRIDSFSMQDNSPEAKLKKFGEIMNNFILPMLPYWQDQGVSINGDGIVKFLAKFANVPELEDFISFASVQKQPGQIPGNPNPERMATPKAPVTTRRYERVNRPGMTRRGQDSTMATLLLGGKPQASDMAAATRQVG